MNNSLHRFVSYFFFSNIFLGIIAVLLCIETNLLSGISVNYIPFYIVVFLGTCLYYTIIYVRSVTAINYNERTIWYRNNLAAIIVTVKFIIAAVLIFVSIMIFRNSHHLFILSFWQWLLLAIFPLLAAWYTFSPRIFHLQKIRKLGMVKPFIIGLTWSGFVTVYPVLIWQIQKGITGSYLYPPVFLWLQNFIFISILAIIFDIKDCKNDTFYKLSTFPVIFGIHNTLRYVALPLLMVNVLVFAIFQATRSFHTSQVAVQAIPYILLLPVVLRGARPQGLLYYLAGIDGLMLLKAICGISAVLFLNK